MQPFAVTRALPCLALCIACASEANGPASPGGNASMGGSTSGGAPKSTALSPEGSGGEQEQSSAPSTANGGSKVTTASKASSTSGASSGGATLSNSGGTRSSSGGSARSSGGTQSTLKSGSAGGAPSGTSASVTSAGGSSARSSTTALPATGGAAPEIVAVGGSHSGEATFYDPNGNGNCSFGTDVLGRDIAALNNPDYDMAAWCGACAEVTGPKGKITVLIQDRCPECKSGDLDLNPEAFDKIADHAAGRVKITWNFVSCEVTGPVKYHFKEGSSAGWTAVQILNHRLPVAKFEYSRDNGATWKSVSRVEYNYFLEEGGFGPNITLVRITSSTGKVLEDMLPIPTSDRVIEGLENF
ncbi:MAG TPA: expansin EXLX1 family cellulose-binding protein [Polyangiaceae bacterium]|nr:expansin EXLX1 family cellulose-binding protein [Polyangiaceae bacterium]